MSLIEKLVAALGETQELATDAAEQVGDGNWQQRAARIVTVADRDREVADYAIVECIEHIVHNDPAHVLRQVAAHRKLLKLHYEIHRDIGWMEDGDEIQQELPVCGHCVPKNSWFKTRADVPLYPCETAKIVADIYEIEEE